MYFEMNGVEYIILEVPQSYFGSDETDGDGYYYGKTYFKEFKICLDKDLNNVKKRKTLIHELLHVYIREYITSYDLPFDEELLCDISANAHDIINKIVEDYFANRNLITAEYNIDGKGNN